MDLSDNKEDMASSLLEITISDSDQDSPQSPNSTTSQTERDYECLICFYPFYSKSLKRETDEKICICPSCASTYHHKCIQEWNQSQQQKNDYGSLEYYGCPKCKYQGELISPEDGSSGSNREVGESAENDSLDISISECPSPTGDSDSSESNSSESNSDSNIDSNNSPEGARSDISYGISSVSSDGMENRGYRLSNNINSNSNNSNRTEECNYDRLCCGFNIIFFGVIIWLSFQK